jgi:hypothetical protein
MSNAMRKGSLLLILAAICAATLVGSPVRTHAATESGGASSWTDDSPGGGTQNGDPDKPDPSWRSGSVQGGSVTYLAPRESVSTGYSFSVSSVTLRGWVQSLYLGLRIRLGW